MKHHDLWRELAEIGGRQLDEDALGRLDRYQQWLFDEAIPAGGIGPREAERLATRHIGDSLLFSVPIPGTPERVVDFGSGAGLPGIPLAILLPDTALVLIDRSGRRIDLLRRAKRVLGLDNVEVVQGEIESHRFREQVIVSRATLPPEAAGERFESMLADEGLAVLGGSWERRPAQAGWETLEVASRVLDQPVWLLIMRRS